MDVAKALKEGGRGSSEGIRGRHLSGVLIVVEMTLAVVLLTGAGLMMRSFVIAYQRPTGVNTRNILTLRLELPDAKYGKPADRLEFERRLIERLRGLPGVVNAAVASGPFGNGNQSFSYELEGQSSDPARRPTIDFLFAGDGYFETLALAARRGRVLNSADHLPGANVAVVNDTMARQVWPRQDAVGKRFRVFRNGVAGEWTTVVGVIPDVLQNGQRPEPNAVATAPIRQSPALGVTILARTNTSAASMGPAFRREVQSLDRDLPVRDVNTLDDQLALSRWPLRVFGAMFAIFAGIALLLATVGLYAVVAYGVNQRTQEIGLRTALGASNGSILGMILRSGMRPAGIGLLLGLAAAFGVTRVLSSLLVGVSPTDPLTFGAVATVLLFAAALGCAVPARRALRIDPAIALRHE
jgi:putative ABC transport system permease protein